MYNTVIIICSTDSIHNLPEYLQGKCKSPLLGIGGMVRLLLNQCRVLNVFLGLSVVINYYGSIAIHVKGYKSSLYTCTLLKKVYTYEYVGNFHLIVPLIIILS